MKSSSTQFVLFKRILANNTGSVMNVALLIFLILLLIVFAGAMSSNVDVKIAQNIKEYERCLYLAEGLATQAVRELEITRASNEEDLTDPARTSYLAGLVKEVSLVSGSSSSIVEADWTTHAQGTNWPDTAAWSGSGNPRTADSFRYLIVDEGAAMVSTDPDDPKLRSYRVSGRAQCNNSDIQITIGYKMLF